MFIAKDEECPQKGRFGVDLLVYLIMLKLSIKSELRRGIFGGDISGAGVVRSHS